jgi:hypothetical protein
MVKTTDLRVEPELSEAKEWYLELANTQKQRFLGAVRIRPDGVIPWLQTGRDFEPKVLVWR